VQPKKKTDSKHIDGIKEVVKTVREYFRRKDGLSGSKMAKQHTLLRTFVKNDLKLKSEVNQK
jgi:hypothetical protein